MQLLPLRDPVACRLAAVILLATAAPCYALTFDFPAAATPSMERVEALSSFRLAIGPAKDGEIASLPIEGALTQTAWQLQAKGLTTLQLLAPLREQLVAQGFRVLFECETFACGGFDFRYGTDVLAEPAMHIDLGDFRYLAAERLTAKGPEHIALMVSRSAASGFVQVTQVSKVAAAPTTRIVEPEPPDLQAIPAPDVPAALDPLEEGFARRGSVPLDDLIFDSGASDLAPGSYASLDTLSAYLLANPDARVALVGHTDASGSLASNIALSKQRAESVRSRMLNDYNIPLDQITAEGVGSLAPRDSNSTETGRTRNRRVEVMLLVGP